MGRPDGAGERAEILVAKQLFQFAVTVFTSTLCRVNRPTDMPETPVHVEHVDGLEHVHSVAVGCRTG